jgi:Caspase domain/WD domain, G-beta repeat
VVGVRFYRAIALILLLWAGSASAEDPQNPPQLYDHPVLVVDPGTHIAAIRSASADRDGRWAVTGSDDKTVRVWSLVDGKLERTIRLPAGPGDIGKVIAVAMSPDGALIAAGGWTRATESDPQEQIYLLDRASGTLVKRIEGLPGNVTSLAFSPNGSGLAAGLYSGGLRVFAKERGWDEAARDDNYGNYRVAMAFSMDGRLATASFDGKVRLYAPGAAGAVRPAATIELSGKLFTIAFSPNGARLAVGSLDMLKVDVLEGHSLITLPPPDMTDIVDSIEFETVGWSRDGEELLAGGRGFGHPSLLAWSQGGAGPRRSLAELTNTLMSLVALPNGDLLEADQSGFSRLARDGTRRWSNHQLFADFRDQESRLRVSTDGMRVGFGYEFRGKGPAIFNMTTRTLLPGQAVDDGMAVPKQLGLNVRSWFDNYFPTLDGNLLSLLPGEMSRSLAIHPSEHSFVLGTDWFLRAYDWRGVPLWSRPAPGEARAVNMTGDGRLVTVAYVGGTIRWHRVTDGAELLAFMPLADRTNWVAWTPEGFYAATAGAQGVLRWHVNRGWDPADSVAVEDIPGSYRPELLPLVLQELETPRALGLAELAEHNRQVMLRTHSHISPGAKLHLLTIGIDQYNEEYAKNLRLRFADRDAHDLASAIVNTQGALYEVRPNVLLDKDANKTDILRALKAMRAAMANGSGNDLAVVHFSGHGALVDHKLYLLPYDVDARDDAGIESKGLSLEELKGELTELAQHGRVLLLLDACHSGATTSNGAALAMDSTAMRAALAGANISVLTSSSGPEVSYEEPELQHGAFTKALLDAFDDPAADVDRNGLITASGLEHYVKNRVPMLTQDKQHPGMEVRYDTTLFAQSR